MSRNLPVVAVITGLAVWMTVAVVNNVTDMETNLLNLRMMTSMTQLKEDALLGNGLEWRAWSRTSPQLILIPVIAWQVMTAGALWWAAISHTAVLMKRLDQRQALARSNLALTMFTVMWLAFLSGGLWFGYWMKQGPIQQVHFTLLILSVCCLTLVNFSCRDDAP